MKSRLYVSKQEYGKESTFVFRIINENGNGVFTFSPVLTRKKQKPVSFKTQARNIIHARLREMVEVLR